MTYNVFGGTLNLAQSINQCMKLLLSLYAVMYVQVCSAEW